MLRRCTRSEIRLLSSTFVDVSLLSITGNDVIYMTWPAACRIHALGFGIRESSERLILTVLIDSDISRLWVSAV